MLLCILILNQILLNHLQQQGANADETPALFRDLSKILESGIGIDPAVAKEKLLLDNHRETTHLSPKEGDGSDA